MKRVFTYSENNTREQLKLLWWWRRAWEQATFEPVVLSRYHARRFVDLKALETLADTLKIAPGQLLQYAALATQLRPKEPGILVGPNVWPRNGLPPDLESFQIGSHRVPALRVYSPEVDALSGNLAGWRALLTSLVTYQGEDAIAKAMEAANAERLDEVKSAHEPANADEAGLVRVNLDVVKSQLEDLSWRAPVI